MSRETGTGNAEIGILHKNAANSAGIPFFWPGKVEKKGVALTASAVFFVIFDRISYIFSRFYAIMRR